MRRILNIVLSIALVCGSVSYAENSPSQATYSTNFLFAQALSLRGPCLKFSPAGPLAAGLVWEYLKESRFQASLNRFRDVGDDDASSQIETQLVANIPLREINRIAPIFIKALQVKRNPNPNPAESLELEQLRSKLEQVYLSEHERLLIETGETIYPDDPRFDAAKLMIHHLIVDMVNKGLEVIDQQAAGELEFDAVIARAKEEAIVVHKRANKKLFDSMRALLEEKSRAAAAVMLRQGSLPPETQRPSGPAPLTRDELTSVPHSALQSGDYQMIMGRPPTGDDVRDLWVTMQRLCKVYQGVEVSLDQLQPYIPLNNDQRLAVMRWLSTHEYGVRPMDLEGAPIVQFSRYAGVPFRYQEIPNKEILKKMRTPKGIQTHIGLLLKYRGVSSDLDRWIVVKDAQFWDKPIQDLRARVDVEAIVQSWERLLLVTDETLITPIEHLELLGLISQAIGAGVDEPLTRRWASFVLFIFKDKWKLACKSYALYFPAANSADLFRNFLNRLFDECRSACNVLTERSSERMTIAEMFTEGRPNFLAPVLLHRALQWMRKNGQPLTLSNGEWRVSRLMSSDAGGDVVGLIPMAEIIQGKSVWDIRSAEGFDRVLSLLVRHYAFKKGTLELLKSSLLVEGASRWARLRGLLVKSAAYSVDPASLRWFFREDEIFSLSPNTAKRYEQGFVLNSADLSEEDNLALGNEIIKGKCEFSVHLGRFEQSFLVRKKILYDPSLDDENLRRSLLKDPSQPVPSAMDVWAECRRLVRGLMIKDGGGQFDFEKLMVFLNEKGYPVEKVKTARSTKPYWQKVPSTPRFLYAFPPYLRTKNARLRDIHAYWDFRAPTTRSKEVVDAEEERFFSWMFRFLRESNLDGLRGLIHAIPFPVIENLSFRWYRWRENFVSHTFVIKGIKIKLGPLTQSFVHMYEFVSRGGRTADIIPSFAELARQGIPSTHFEAIGLSMEQFWYYGLVERRETSGGDGASYEWRFTPAGIKVAKALLKSS